MTLRRDFEMLRRRYETPAQKGQGDASAKFAPACDPGDRVAKLATPVERRTNADKRRDVLSMLDAEPGLADREIARRCGVSPQTVGNLRRSWS